MEENNQKAKKAPLIYAIVGVMTLIVAVAGSTYAFYAATVSNSTDVTGTAGGGEGPEMTITNLTKNEAGQTTPYGNLIPIDMNASMLSAAAKGSAKTGNIPCIDSNNYTACQIYSVTITNNANTAQSYYIDLTALSGTNTPNVDAVTMESVNSVTDASSLIKDADGDVLATNSEDRRICQTNTVAAGATTTECYFMVFIKNLSEAQSDNGVFSGTVTATSTTGAQTKADFS